MFMEGEKEKINWQPRLNKGKDGFNWVNKARKDKEIKLSS